MLVQRYTSRAVNLDVQPEVVLTRLYQGTDALVAVDTTIFIRISVVCMIYTYKNYNRLLWMLPPSSRMDPPPSSEANVVPVSFREVPGGCGSGSCTKFFIASPRLC